MGPLRSAALFLGIASIVGCTSSVQSDGGVEPRCDPAPSLPSPPCAAGYFLYVDPVCGPTPDGGIPCSREAGDGRCHRECTEDADCTDPCRPLCRQLGLFAGGDYNCNRTVRICRSEDRNDCSR